MNQKKQATTFGDWGTIAIEKHYQKILKHQPKVLKDKNPEELHQMRVGMRRLRSTIDGFAPALNIPKAAESKKIGKIAKTLGQLRDLDVLIETLSTKYISALPKKEQKTLSKIIKILHRKRKKAFKEVKLTLNNQNYQDFSVKIAKWLNNSQYQPIAALDIKDVLPDLLSPQISKLLLHPGWFIKLSHQDDPNMVEQTLIEEGEILHDLRKEAKRSRYNLELFTEFYCNTYAQYLQQIKQLQSVLGEIQDSFVLRETLEKILQANIGEKMPTLARELQKNRYQKWQEWLVLQQQFLDTNKRQDLRITLQYPE